MPEKVALVLVHGILSEGSKWDPLCNLLLRDEELAGRIEIIAVEYPSKLIELDPKRQIPDLDTVAGYLGTRLSEELHPDRPIVFAGHSQGGLIVQRYLVQQLHQGHGLALRRVRQVLMFATPNSGSEYLLPLRKWWSRNPQEIELRPLNEKIVETQKVILQQIVYAKEFSTISAPIPFGVYAGITDRVVPPQSAKSVFPDTGELPGDHSSIIVPSSIDDLVYVIIKARLLRVLEASEPAAAAARPDGRVTQLDEAIDRGLRSQHVAPQSGFRLSEDAIREIAVAMAEIEDLKDSTTRQQFMSLMPAYILERQGSTGGNAKIQLALLVKRCANIGDAGRQALLLVMDFLPSEDAAVAHARAAIEDRWPPAS
ncbi:esterase/lipase family protein [Nocardia sp. SC052]|uniref:esterase/lipase family protein n=1 Tax=Nocardia sichangensis TaxID=3385975 RepID=UPI0039A0412B